MRLRTAIGASAVLLLVTSTAVVGALNAAASTSDNDPEIKTVCVVYSTPTGPGLGHGGIELAEAGTDCFQGVASFVESVTEGTVSASDSTSLDEANAAVNRYWAVQSSQDGASKDSLLAGSSIVAHGCDLANFVGTTCWDFVVPSSTGCTSSTSWHWGTLTMDGLLSSWAASGSCSHGTLYDLQYEPPGSVQITCYTCYSLGGMDNRTSSLGVYY